MIHTQRKPHASMEDFSIDKWISGFAVCRDCGHVWVAVVPYGQFFSLKCPNCHNLVGELSEAHLC